MREFEASEHKLENFSSSDFLPETYILDMLSDEIAFINAKSEGIWILKPHNANQGKGISLISDIKRFKEEFVKSKKFSLGEYTTNFLLSHKLKENKLTAEDEILKEK